MSIIQTLSLTEKIKLFFSGKTALFGLIFFVFGMVFLIVFGSASDLSQIKFLLFTKKTTTGQVIESGSTNYSENERTVMKHTFEYTAQGNKYFGKSYSSQRYYKAGNTVEVEYLAFQPKVSRIKGMKRRPFGFLVILLVGIFPGIGFIFLWINLSETLHKIFVLQNSGVTTATLLTSSITNTRINNRPVYKVELEYTVLGKTYRNITKTLNPHLLEDNEKEPLIYSKKKPEKSIMFDMLPLSIQDKLGLRFPLLKDHHYGPYPEPE